MILKPSNVQPSGHSFDATDDIEISWKNNGDIMEKYQIEVQDNFDNSPVLSTLIITSYQSTYIIAGDTLENNKTYRYRVKVFNSVDEYQYSDWFILNTSAKPTVGIITDGIVRNQTATFQATYSQVDDVSLKSYRFYLYNEHDDIIKITDEIFDGLLQYTFSNLDSNADYYIECQSTSQNGVIGTSNKIPFKAVYASPVASKSVVVVPLNNKPIVKVDWQNAKQVFAEFIGSTPTYVDGKFGKAINLENDDKVLFNEEIPVDFTLKKWVKKQSGFTGLIFEASNDEGDCIRLGYNGDSFYYQAKQGNNNRYITTSPIALPTEYFFVALRNTEAIICVDNATLIKLS